MAPFDEGPDEGENAHTLAEWFFARVVQELGTTRRSFDRRFAFLGEERCDAVLGWYWVHRDRFARFLYFAEYAGEGWPAGEWVLGGDAVRRAIVEAILAVLPVDEGIELYLGWLRVPVIVETMLPKVAREPSKREVLRRSGAVPRRWGVRGTREVRRRP